TRKKKRTPDARESAFLSPVSPRHVVERGSGGEASETLEHSPSGEAAGEAHSGARLPYCRGQVSPPRAGSQVQTPCPHAPTDPPPPRDHARRTTTSLPLPPAHTAGALTRGSRAAPGRIP